MATTSDAIRPSLFVLRWDCCVMLSDGGAGFASPESKHPHSGSVWRKAANEAWPRRQSRPAGRKILAQGGKP